MSYVLSIGCIILFVTIISFFWVRGIDYMKENHPDYKGEDFLNWDDNKNHTEDQI